MESGIRTKIGDIDGKVQSRAGRRMSSPSPLPSPPGRGSPACRFSASPSASVERTYCQRFSLSLGERAGARGEEASVPETAPLKRTTFSQSWLSIFIGCVFSVSAAYACKYNVRDVGFVDLEQTSYKLYCLADRATPKEFSNALRQTASATFLEANVEFETVSIDGDENHPAL